MRLSLLLLWNILIMPLLASAEFVELGLSGNYRKTFLQDSNDSNARATDEMSAYTASIAYYFQEMTAFEVSYTKGESRREIPTSTISSITTHSYDMLGSDLVLTFGTRNDNFIPYIKGGVGYFLKKKIRYQYYGAATTDQTVQLDPTLVPSLGLGMKSRITERFSIKTGIEMWTSGPIKKKLDQFDWAARIGLSWFL